jgi:putative ABC transport system substrate-binding protein
MRRREFIAGLGGAAVVGPVTALAPRVARAQTMRRIGILLTAAQSDPATLEYINGFQRRLGELGWVEPRNISFIPRWAAGDLDRIRANIGEIAKLAPDVIVAQNTPMVAELRKQVTSIPVVFVQVSDPVGDGFVAALARPGGNMTGFTNTMSSLGGKWLELLRDAVPGLSRVGFVYNRTAAPGGGAYYLEPFQAAAKALGIEGVPIELRTADEIDAVLASFAATGGNGIVTDSDAFITLNRDRIIAATNTHRLPATFTSAIFTRAGGLLSYGADSPGQWQAAAGYVDRILRGEKPGNLPVQQPAKFVLTINLKTAKAIGVEVPLFLQQRADEVIE